MQAIVNSQRGYLRARVCRSPDSLLQLQLAQLRERNDAKRVFPQLPPFHILQHQWPLVSAAAQSADGESEKLKENRRIIYTPRKLLLEIADFCASNDATRPIVNFAVARSSFIKCACNYYKWRQIVSFNVYTTHNFF